jgi:hypothetical protein
MSLSSILSLRSRELRLNALFSYVEIVKSTIIDSSICVRTVHNTICCLMLTVTCCVPYVYGRLMLAVTCCLPYGFLM